MDDFSWIQSFIRLDGIQCLVNLLSNLNSKPQRKDRDGDLEFELIRCLKVLIDNKVLLKKETQKPKS